MFLENHVPKGMRETKCQTKIKSGVSVTKKKGLLFSDSESGVQILQNRSMDRLLKRSSPLQTGAQHAATFGVKNGQILHTMTGRH